MQFKPNNSWPNNKIITINNIVAESTVNTLLNILKHDDAACGSTAFREGNAYKRNITINVR